jgi:hypothetical protein
MVPLLYEHGALPISIFVSVTAQNWSTYRVRKRRMFLNVERAD